MNKRVILGIVIVIAIIGAGFIFWPALKDTGEEVPPVDEAPGTGSQEVMDLTHTFEDGVHTIAGTVMLPTPCHELQQDVQIAESFPEQVTITLNSADTGGICIQVIDEREFSVDVEASEQATFTLIFEGSQVTVPSLAN